MTLKLTPIIAALATAAVLMPASAYAAGPYEGEVVKIIVPHGPSGPMNQYARMIAPHLAKHLGASDVRVDNQPGAGTLKGTNMLRYADPDGLTIAFTSVATPVLAQLAESPGVQFDAKDFVYLGRVAFDPRFLYVAENSDIDSIEDLMKLDRPFVYPAQGTDEDFYTMAMLSKALGFDIKINTGYDGIADSTLALVKGEADGFMASWPSARAAVENGDLKPILALREERDPDRPDVPTIFEVVQDPDKQEMAHRILDIQSLFRTFFGPPGMDPEHVAAMREALAATIADPELIAQSEQMQLPVSFADGQTMQDRVTAVMQSSQTLKPVMAEALESIQ
jgi:tripartite-type tricarboxylate transporter receptor subunit TctC